MRILFMSKAADGYCVALRLAQEGNQVWFYNNETKSRITGKGSNNPLPIDNYQPYVKTADLIVFDMVGMGKLADDFRRLGKPVFGASEIADKMELDRAFAQNVMKLTGATIPEWHEFKNIREGVKFLEKADKPFVFKPLGNKFNKWTFVPKDDSNEAEISFMQNMKVQSLDFVLQEKVEGIEISTEGFFNGRDWVAPFNHTIERKRLMEGDKGPQTGCQGNIVWITEGDRLTEELLMPLTPYLKKNRYIGPIDVNAIINKDKANFLEFTCRLGYSASQAMFTLLRDDVAHLMNGVARGNVSELDFHPGYAIAVRISMPPYPNEMSEKDKQEVRGMKVINYPAYLKKVIWLSDAMYTKEKEPVLAGTDGVVADVTFIGDSIDECRDGVYDVIDHIVITKDMQYRSDIGEEDAEKIEQLIEWGWLNDDADDTGRLGNGD